MDDEERGLREEGKKNKTGRNGEQEIDWRQERKNKERKEEK